MNSLKDRCLIVLRGAGQPLTSAQVARILGLPTQQVTSPISRLCAYGSVERIAMLKDGALRENLWRAKEVAA